MINSLEFFVFLGMLTKVALSPIALAFAFIVYRITNKKDIGVRIITIVGAGLIYVLFSSWIVSYAQGSNSLQISMVILRFVVFVVDVGFIFLIAKIINLFKITATKNQ